MEAVIWGLNSLTPHPLRRLIRNKPMVKPKQRTNHGASGKKHQNHGSPNADPPDDGDWMMVKKQRITIIIPPLPNKKHVEMSCVGESQLQEKPRNTNSQSPRKITTPQSPRNSINSKSPRKTNSKLLCPSANSASIPSVHEPEKSGSSPEQAMQPPLVMLLPEPNLNRENPSNTSRRTTSANPSPLIHSPGQGNVGGPCSATKGMKGTKTFAHSTPFLDLRMRASYLERKLKNWRLSVWRISSKFSRREGLEDFSWKILQCRSLKTWAQRLLGQGES